MSKAQTLGDAHAPVLVQRAAEVHPHNKPILSLTLNLMFRSLLKWENCPEHLLDVDHSRQILQVCITCDDLSFLILGGCIYYSISHCQAVSQTQISSKIGD